ncbi:hypothetical protein HG537_0H00330 [Torulaspora globosa]|uniref:HAD-superfamily hydrolase n=1 Tax=Torulaspora globosa TaxID=48254 RepID=A0A7H9I0H5_9SACH|nr:hypothetical protein HG537_0H00330 [Torulaspora sp. CBS 2947]
MVDKISETLNEFSKKPVEKVFGKTAKTTSGSGGSVGEEDERKPVNFPRASEDEDPKSTVPENDRTVEAKPRTKSFLDNDKPENFMPVTRKKRVSSLSLSDQWIGGAAPMTPLDSGDRKNSAVSSNGLPSRRSSMAVREKKKIIDHERIASYAFAFDIDGVLVRGPETIPQAPEALRMLNGENKYNIKVPYIFITNGGGRSEKARCKDLSKRLGITVTEDQVIQGHTPMKDLVPVYKNVLVVGGVLDSCRKVAEGYGFKNVYIPLDIMKWNPSVTPYYQLSEEEKRIARDVDFSKVNIDAILVFADSRNWAADQQIILELLLSENGVMGTICPTADKGPGLYFAHSDFVWATDYGLNRYGMGALQVSIAALYQEHTGKELEVTRFGKPQRGTFRFAEKVLSNWRRETLSEHVEQLKLEDCPDGAGKLESERNDSPLVSDSSDEEEEMPNDPFGEKGITLERGSKMILELPPASTVYFVGDTPESDIRFANSHDSSWYSILVKTGVYQDGATPRYKPKQICDNVLEAVKFAIEREHQKELKEWNDSATVRAPVVEEKKEVVVEKN